MNTQFSTPVRFALLVFLLTGSIAAQGLSPDEAFVWSATGPIKTLKPSDSSEVILTLTIAPGHYVYRDFLSVKAQPPAGIEALPAIYPKPELKFDKFENKEVAIYEKTVQIRLPIRITANAPSGELPVTLTVKHRGCSSKVCFFPSTRKLTVKVTINGGEGTAAPAGFIPIEKAPPEKNDLFSKGLLGAFLFVFLGGLLTSLTPCVYPLIPVTVAIFGARGVRRMRGFTLSLTYVCGICLMYSILGLIAASTGAVFGSIMVNPIVVGVLVVILIALGLSMLGAFELRAPTGLQTRLGSVGGSGYTGAFGMGLVAGIIAAPCTGPVLASVLVYVAATGNLFLGFWLLFVFASGLGALFVVLGTFSSVISYLPQSGAWMESVKNLFGVILLAMALYFGKSAYPILNTLLLPIPAGLIIGVVFVLISLPMGSIYPSFCNLSGFRRGLKVAGVVFAVAGLYCGAGAFTVPKKGPVHWVYNETAGLQQAQSEKKPVIVDVWAEWCAACRELDATTFRDPRVVKRLKHFVTIKLDFSRDTPERARLQKRYNIPGMPVLLFYDSNGIFLSEARLIGYHDADALLKHLDQLGL